MKKRSLVAALAMLVVSAIVLTSSTYAWFATSAAANVTTFSATVTNNSGNLTVKATGAEAVENAAAKTSISVADYKEDALCDTLSPVSLYIGADGPVVNTLTYKDGKYTGLTAAVRNSQYLCYEFQASYISGADEADGKTITLTPKISDNGSKLFCYALVAVKTTAGTSYYYYSAGGYIPVKTLTSDVVDDGDDIIDAGDTGYLEGDMASGTELIESAGTAITGNAINIMTSAGKGATTTADITVYIWAEGQDAQCSGAVSGSMVSAAFDLAVVA